MSTRQNEPMIPMANLAAQHERLQQHIEDSVCSVLRSGAYILGQNVSNFENDIAALCGVRHAIGVGNGTDALLLALMAIGVGPGDEVITCPFTFVATVETVVLLGAKPVFVDIDPATFTMDAEQLAEKITNRTKAIIPVHLFGQIADLRSVYALVKHHGIAIIGDAAQAIASTQDNLPLGQLADMSTLSFYPTKNLGAAGDGGMIVTDDDNLAEQLRILRFHGSKGTYNYQTVGVCSRLDALQAAILSVKLTHLLEWTDQRRKHAALYLDAFADIDELILPRTLSGNHHTYHQFTLSIKQGKRDALKEYMHLKGISTGIFYPIALHLAPAYTDIVEGYVGQFPHSEAACRNVLSIPIHPELKSSECTRVIDVVRSFWS